MKAPYERLREAREKKYPSAAEAAAAMRISYGTYSCHENGSRKLSAAAADRYAMFFGVNVNWLLYERGPRDRSENVIARISELNSNNLGLVENLIRDMLNQQERQTAPEAMSEPEPARGKKPRRHSA